MVKIYRRSVFQRTGNGFVAVQARRFFQENNQSRSWRAEIGKRHNVAALDLIDAEIRQIDGRPHSRLRDFQFVAVALNRTNPCFEIARVNNDLLAAAQGSAGQCPRHNCADSTQREHPIDKQAWLADVALRLRSCEFASERVFQIFNALTGADRSRNDRRICEEMCQRVFREFAS